MQHPASGNQDIMLVERAWYRGGSYRGFSLPDARLGAAWRWPSRSKGQCSRPRWPGPGQPGSWQSSYARGQRRTWRSVAVPAPDIQDVRRLLLDSLAEPRRGYTDHRPYSRSMLAARHPWSLLNATKATGPSRTDRLEASFCLLQNILAPGVTLAISLVMAARWPKFHLAHCSQYT